jgi:hypothetical protein
MAPSDAMTKVLAAESACAAAATAVADPDDIPASEAVRLYEALDRAVRSLSAGRTLLAKRVEASKQWERKGFGSAAEHLAQISGKSLGAARSELETSGALTHLPATRSALLEGRVSETQGQLIANAARVNPEAERSLIKKAQRTNHQELRDEAHRAKAAADPDPAATHRRIHRDRRLGRHTDPEGAWNLHARGTVSDGSIVAAEIDRLTDEIFRANGKAGTQECRDAYAFDALTEMARRSSGLRHCAPDPEAKKAGLGAPQHLALLRLDVAALWRGYVEGDELCEVTGLGPIPVEVARTLLGDAVLKLIITKGVDIASVTSLTRGPTQAMHYAKLWMSPTCIVEGCTRTIVEYDHEWGAEYKDTRHTRLDEIERKCHTHHDLHTRLGWALVAGKGERPMVAPDDPRHPAHAPPRAPTSGAPPPGAQPDLFGVALT